ncbi:MAG TPA: hypothetical protein V6C81_30940 [Planktothrix sp.]|jgi:hypothetical protein
MDFFITDLASVFLAYLACPLFFLLPGVAIGGLFDVLQFNQRSILARLAIAVLISLSVTPVTSYVAAKLIGFDFAVILDCVIGLSALAWLIARIRSSGVQKTTLMAELKEHRVVVLIALAWTIYAPLMIMDWQHGRHIYNSVILYDWSRNITVGDAIRATGVPPNNFYLCHVEPFKLFYCYYWMLAGCLPAFTTQSINPNNAFPSLIATSIWSGYGFFAAVVMLCRQLYEGKIRNIARNAVCLLCLGGIHIAILEPYCLANHIVLPTMEPNASIVGLAQAMLWVPQHLTSLIAGTTGSLLLMEALTRNRRVKTCAVLAGLSFASALGCSPYVTVTFAIFWTLYGLYFLFRRQLRSVVIAASAGATAAVASLPELLELHSFHRANQLALSLPLFRSNNASPSWPDQMHISQAMQGPFILFVLVPMRFLVGLAPAISVSLWYWLRKMYTRTDIYCVPMVLVSVFCSTFLHSSGFAATNDDMAQRSFMPMQVLLTIWTARSLASAQFWRRKIICVPLCLLLVLGALAMPGEFYFLRRYTMSTNPQTMDTERLYDLREVFTKLEPVLDKSARIASNVNIDLFKDYVYPVLYSHRQQLAADRRRSVVFGGTDEAYDDVTNATNLVLADGTKDATATLFNRFKVGALIVMDNNPVWTKPDSWLMQQKPFFQNQHFKAYTRGSLGL